jgi:hypothetical protein
MTLLEIVIQIFLARLEEVSVQIFETIQTNSVNLELATNFGISALVESKHDQNCKHAKVLSSKTLASRSFIRILGTG